MIGMGETYVDGHGLEGLGRVKNTSPTLPTYTPARTVEEIEEEVRIENILRKAELMVGDKIIGITKKEMEDLFHYKYKDPISVWISWKRPIETDEETFY